MLASSLRAQTGSWSPAGANCSFPRTLLKANELARVRESLAAPTRQALYAGLYAEIRGGAPNDNTSAASRRNRATFTKNAAFVVLLAQQPTSVGLAPLPATERAALVALARPHSKT